MEDIVKAIVIKNNDNVATALSNLEKKQNILLEYDENKKNVTLVNNIPFGHKFSLVKILTGSVIIKYGEIIGTAKEDILPGEWVHVHNVASTRGRGDLKEK